MASKGKKRYYVTLTQDSVEAFQAMAEDMNLGVGAMSNMLDDYLAEMVATMSHYKGKLTFAGILKMVAEESDKERELRHDKEKVYEVPKTASCRKKT